MWCQSHGLGNIEWEDRFQRNIARNKYTEPRICEFINQVVDDVIGTCMECQRLTLHKSVRKIIVLASESGMSQ